MKNSILVSSFSILFSLVFLYSFTANAQKNYDIVIEGTVFNGTSKKPLPYASISLLNNKMGTVSNINGEFRIIVPLTDKNDSLRISYIGFKSNLFKVSEVKKVHRFFLEENTEILNELVITGLSAQSIIKKALESIPKNYYNEPYKSKGFYRLTAKKEEQYIRLSEATFDLYHSLKKNNKNQLRLEKMREIKDENTLHNMDIGAKPKAIFESDVINNLSESGFLDKKGIKNHAFSLKERTSYNNKEVYLISFDQKDGIKKVGYQGKLYIDVETFAFIHLDYGMSPKSIQYHKIGNLPQRMLMELLDMHIAIPKFDMKISYKRVGSKYYLSNVNVNAINSVQSSREQFDFDAVLHMDYVITDIETENCIPFTNEEVLGNNKWLEKQHSIYDQTFWSEYNVILPNFNFAAIAKNITAKNKAKKLKTEIQNLLYKYPKDRRGRMDSILSFYNKKNLFNGNALISYNGEIIFQKSYNNSLTQNHSKTQFRIGSTSKTFTSMLIMLLENEGKLNTSDSVGMYLPNYTHKDITIEQLLTHQSGIPNYTVNDD